MSQRIITIDSQILNSIQSCALKTKYSHIQNLKPTSKAAALERGDLMHRLLEPYYSLLMDEPNFNTETWKELKAAGIEPKKPVETGVASGYYFATKLELPIDICEETIYQFREYAEHYRHDQWHPLAVEEVGTKVMYEDDDIRIDYVFKIDLVAEKGHLVAPFDHKTSKQRKEPSSMSNQFIGYAWGLGVNNVVVNKIGFQKTLRPDERFQRYTLPIDNERIEEWIKNSTWWIKYLDSCIKEDNWPMNLTSCDKYDGCIFRRICEANPQVREAKLSRDFDAGEEWDVAVALEED